MASAELEAQVARLEKATFAMGSFWGSEGVFRFQLRVFETQAGYMGGHVPRPSFDDVAINTTGHAEVVQVTFDPHDRMYEALLRAFWTSHDPTAVDRLDPTNEAHRYRSAIFFHTPHQEDLARASRDQREARLGRPVLTDIVPATTFWPATEKHQHYLSKRRLHERFYPHDVRRHDYPLRWLTHVWARGFAVIDGRLLLDVVGPADAHTVDVVTTCWATDEIAGRGPVLMTTETTASWDGDEWHLD